MEILQYPIPVPSFPVPILQTAIWFIRVFSGSGIWPKYRAGIGKTINILTESGIWLLLRKRDSPKFGHGKRDFFACLLGIQEIATTQINVLAGQSRWCLLSNQTIETVREYFVSIRCQKSPRGVIAYQLLTSCSIDLVSQALQSLRRFTFIVVLKGFFSTTYLLDAG